MLRLIRDLLILIKYLGEVEAAPLWSVETWRFGNKQHAGLIRRGYCCYMIDLCLN